MLDAFGEDHLATPHSCVVWFEGGINLMGVFIQYCQTYGTDAPSYGMCYILKRFTMLSEYGCISLDLTGRSQLF